MNRYVYAANNPVNGMDPSGYGVVEYLQIQLYRASAAVTASYFVVRGYYTLMSYILQLAPYTDEILQWFSAAQLTYQVGSNIISGLQNMAAPVSSSSFTPTQSEETSESQEPEKTIVDLGSGVEGRWARQLKMMNPDARVIATETGGNFDLLKWNLEGTGIESYDGWDSVPDGIADETWAVAPFPRYHVRIAEGKAGLRITKPGGLFHMVILLGEMPTESELRDELREISPIHAWYIEKRKIGSLGIPSEYYPSDYGVWYITAIR